MFPNRLSVALWSVILSPIDVIFLWLEYDRIIAPSGDPNVTATHVSLNSRFICLARVSRIIAMACHVQVSLISVFFYGLNLVRVSPRIFIRDIINSAIALTINYYSIQLLKVRKCQKGSIFYLRNHIPYSQG